MFASQNKTAPNLFLGNIQQPPQNTAFTQNQTLNNNMFANKITPGLGIFNTNTNQNTNQPNMFTSNSQQPQSNNFFAQQQQQSQGTGFFNRGTTTMTPGVFNQTGNTNTQVGGGFLNQAATTTSPANFFNQGSLGGNTQFNLPNQTQSTGFLTNASIQPTTMPQMNSFQAFPNIPLTDANMQQIRTAPPEQRKQFLQMFHREQIRNMIEYFRKPIQFLKTDRLQLTPDNPLRGEKITEVAAALNIKPQILHVKREVKNNLTDRIKKLNEDKQKMDILSNDFAKNVFPKLRKYKQQLLIAIGQNKMIEQVQKEMDELENQLKDFFKPMFNAQQNKYCLSFVDPNRFCVKVTEKLFKNMISLNNLMDDLLVCQGQKIEGDVDAGDVILQLIEYYQNVAVAVKDYTSRYNQLKKKLLKRGRSKNTGQILRKIGEMATSQMKKDMQPYELVKQIQCILEKREQKLMQQEQ